MEYSTTIGVDVSDRTSKICVMAKTPDGGRRIVAETTCATTKDGFAEAAVKFDRSWPVVFETGTHCRWMERHFKSLGFRVIVANPAKVKLMGDPTSKTDRNDARKLARLALADPALLHPVSLRGEKYQRMLRLHEARQLLMRMRTSAICQVRSFAKSMGFRLPGVSPERFHALDMAGLPDDFERTVWPMMDAVKTVNLKIAAYDALIDELAGEPEFKAMVKRAMEIYGVGVIGATAVVAAIDGAPGRFARARDVGPYLGMTPRKFQSGESDPQLGTTKAGNDLVRRVLVECANVVMKENAKDTDLKLKGLRIGARGGSIARKKAKVAVARGLAVLVVALLKDPSRKYVPLSDRGIAGFERYRAERELLAPGKGRMAVV